MPTAETIAANKQAQAQEAQERGAPAGDVMPVLDADNARPDPAPVPQPSAPPAKVEEPDSKQPVKSRYNQQRDEIVANFRKGREAASEDNAAEAAEMRALTHDGIPPELLPQAPAAVEEPDEIEEVEPAVADSPAATPPKRKVVVRGKEIELTEEELVAHAQKALAGDDYLEEARKKLDRTNELLRDTEQRARTTPAAAKHPGQGEGAQTTELGDDPAEDGEHSAKSPMAELIETIQFGDPGEAAAQLTRVIGEQVARGSQQAAKETVERERMRDEAVRSNKFLKDFQEKNAELANDEDAAAWMEHKLYRLQADDIKKLGVDEAKLPRSPQDIANWHLWYRANGFSVQSVPDLLVKARDELVKWKGVDKKPDDPVRKAEPRVEVAVDRTQRRQNIPQQPSRTVTPRPDAAAAQAPVARDRSAIVQQMALDRARPRGKILG